MKWRYVALALAAATLICLVACLILPLTVPPRKVPTRDVADLLIELSNFPTGWIETSRTTESRQGPTDPLLGESGLLDQTARADFSPEHHYRGSYSMRYSASHSVERAYNERAAATEFTGLATDRHYDPAAKISGLTYHSQVADRFRMRCVTATQKLDSSRMESWTECTAYAQYDEFVSVFHASIGPDPSLSVQDFERLLRIIDERMQKEVIEPRKEGRH